MGYCSTPGCHLPDCDPRTPWGTNYNPRINDLRYQDFNLYAREVIVPSLIEHNQRTKESEQRTEVKPPIGDKV